MKRFIYLISILIMLSSCYKESIESEKEVSIDSISTKGMISADSSGFNITGSNWFNDTIIIITIPDTTKVDTTNKCKCN